MVSWELIQNTAHRLRLTLANREAHHYNVIGLRRQGATVGVNRGSIVVRRAPAAFVVAAAASPEMLLSAVARRATQNASLVDARGIRLSKP